MEFHKGLRDKLKEEIKTIHLPRIQQNPLYGDPVGEPFWAKGIRSYQTKSLTGKPKEL